MECVTLRTPSIHLKRLSGYTLPPQTYIDNTILLQKIDTFPSINGYKAIHLHSFVYVYVGPLSSMEGFIQSHQAYGWYDDQRKCAFIISEREMNFRAPVSPLTPKQRIPVGNHTFVVTIPIRAKNFAFGHYEGNILPLFIQVLPSNELNATMAMQTTMAENKIAPDIVDVDQTKIVSERGERVSLTRWLFTQGVSEKETKNVMRNLISTFLRLDYLGYEIDNIGPERVFVSPYDNTVIFIDQRDFRVKGNAPKKYYYRTMEKFASNLYAAVNEVLTKREINVPHRPNGPFNMPVPPQAAIFVASFPYDVGGAYKMYNKQNSDVQFEDYILQQTMEDMDFSATEEKRLWCKYSETYEDAIILEKSDLYPALINTPKLYTTINVLIDNGLEHPVYLKPHMTVYHELMKDMSFYLWIGEVNRSVIALQHYFSTLYSAGKIISVWNCNRTFHVLARNEANDFVPFADYIIRNPNNTSVVWKVIQRLFQMVYHFGLHFESVDIRTFYINLDTIYFEALYTTTPMDKNQPNTDIGHFVDSVYSHVPSLTSGAIHDLLQKIKVTTAQHPNTTIANTENAFDKFKSRVLSLA